MRGKWIAVSIVLCLGSLTALGQWATQTMELKPGWNGVYLHVDASYTTINELEGLDENIEEIWLWKPQVTAAQFIKSPDTPTNRKSRWLSRTKNLGSSSSLQRLIGNSAYLVRYGKTDEGGNWIPASGKAWGVKGRPIPPTYSWTSTGLNLIGFSSHSTTAPSIDSYFPQTVMNDLEFFSYQGGDLSSTNPSQVFALRNSKVKRGEAFWVRSKNGQFNNYFAPFDIVLQDYQGLVFGVNRGQYRVIIRNRTDRGLIVTLNHRKSESKPANPVGLQDYAEGIKLMVRGEVNPVDLTYDHSVLNIGDNHRVTLTASGKPGSSREIILGLDRTGLTGATETRYGSLLELTDSLGHAEVSVPVSATKSSNTGLWVGNAKIKEVRHDLTFFEKNPDDQDIVLDADGKAVILNRDDFYGRVPNPFPLRLILHQGETVAVTDAEGNPVLDAGGIAVTEEVEVTTGGLKLFRPSTTGFNKGQNNLPKQF